MTYSKLLLAGVAALALVACGKKDNSGGSAPASQASEKAAKVGTASPLEQKFTLKGAAPVDIDSFFALMPESGRPTYAAAAFDKALGATVVTDLRFADSDDGEALTVARAEFFGLDMDAIARVRDAQDVGADAPFETVFTKVRLHDVATEGFEGGGEAASLTIGGVELDKLQLRQGGAQGDGEGEEGARFVNAVNLAGIYFKDFTLAADAPDSASFIATLPDFRLVGVGGGKIGAVVANDAEYTLEQSAQGRAAMSDAMGPQAAMFLNGPLGGFIAPENQHVLMKSFAWRDIDFSGLLAWGLKGEKPPMSAERLIDLGTIKALDIESYVNGKRAATVAETTMTAGAFTWMAPSDIRVESKGASYDFTAYVPEEEEETIKVLKDHGLDAVKGDGAMSWLWNAKSGAADLDYGINMEKLIDIDVKLGFADLKLSDLAAAAEDGESNVVLEQGAFKNFSVSLKDEKALDALFAISALQMGGSGEDLRASAPALIRLSGAQAGQMNPRIPGYVDAVANFIAKGGALQIQAAPANPVSFLSLQEASASGPQSLPDVLDLKVTHKE